jgi:hypothetical protein
MRVRESHAALAWAVELEAAPVVVAAAAAVVPVGVVAAAAVAAGRALDEETV